MNKLTKNEIRNLLKENFPIFTNSEFFKDYSNDYNKILLQDPLSDLYITLNFYYFRSNDPDNKTKKNYMSLHFTYGPSEFSVELMFRIVDLITENSFTEPVYTYINNREVKDGESEYFMNINEREDCIEIRDKETLCMMLQDNNILATIINDTMLIETLCSSLDLYWNGDYWQYEEKNFKKLCRLLICAYNPDYYFDYNMAYHSGEIRIFKNIKKKE